MSLGDPLSLHLAHKNANVLDTLPAAALLINLVAQRRHSQPWSVACLLTNAPWVLLDGSPLTDEQLSRAKAFPLAALDPSTVAKLLTHNGDALTAATVSEVLAVAHATATSTPINLGDGTLCSIPHFTSAPPPLPARISSDDLVIVAPTNEYLTAITPPSSQLL